MSNLVIESEQDINYAKIEAWMAQQIGEELVLHYPGYKWAVQVNAPGGVAYIRNMNVDGDKGFIIHLAGKNAHDLQMQAIKAGGEMLERYGLTRGQARIAELAGMERDFMGRGIQV